MTGRGADRSARPRMSRVGRLLALLGTLVILSGSAIHHAASEGHHRPAAAAVVAATQSVQSSSGRADLHAVAIESPPAVRPAQVTVGRPEAETFTASAVVELVRTRGPPVLA